MIKKTLVGLIFFILSFLVNPSTAFAASGPYVACTPPEACDPGWSCQPYTKGPPFACQPDAFGTISPPPALKDLIGKDPTGAGAISKFLTNLVQLFYIVATIVLIFMIIWGGWDWITSEGDKEKLESAKKKLINAFIGLLIFAAAFAIIQVLGQFTGFTFFVGQKQ